MGIFKILFRKNQEIFVATKPQTNTPISYVRRKYLLLGAEYSVQITKGDRNSLRIEGQCFVVTLSEMSSENFETFMQNWYRRTARRIFQESIDRLNFESTKPQIKVYKMSRAWGRCYYQKGVITLNLHLIKAPQECVDYIILHEMCHFTHHNHGAQFKEMVARHDPQWSVKDQTLKEFARKRATILQKLHI